MDFFKIISDWYHLRNPANRQMNGYKFNASLAEVITGYSTLGRLVIILKKKFAWGSGDINFAIAKYTCLL